MILLRSLEVQALKHLHDIHVDFPPQGSILIEGPNESGKSTVFEAIYFALYGFPLQSEDGPPSLLLLIPYEGTTANVTLKLAAGPAELEVRRTLTRGKRGVQHDARLLIRKGRGMPEELYGARAVTDRLMVEMHGLDGDALRTSCLVEQGALDRLESLSRSHREEAIAKLLGLQRLVMVEHELRPTHDELVALERLRAEHEVATRQDAAKTAAAKEAEVAAHLSSARANIAMAERDTLAAKLDEHAQQTQAMVARIETLDSLVTHAGLITDLVSEIDSQAERAEAAGRLASELAGTHAYLAELDHIAQNELPQALERMDALYAAEGHLTAAVQARDALELATRRLRVADLDDRITRDDDLLPAIDLYMTRRRDLADTEQTHRLAQADAEAQARVAQAQGAQKSAEDAVELAQHAAHQANVRDIIAYWVRLKEVERLREGEDEVKLLADQRDEQTVHLDRVGHRQIRLAWLVLLCLIVAGGASVASVAYSEARLPLQLVAGLAFLTLWVCIGFYAATLVRARRADTTLRETERKLSRASIRSEAATLLGGSVEEIPQVEADLHTAGQAVPSGIEDGRQVLNNMLAADPTTLTDAQDRARQALLDLERSRGEVRTASRQAQEAREARGGSRATVEELAQRVGHAQQLVEYAENAAQALVREPLTWPAERAEVLASRAGLVAERAEVARTLDLPARQMLDIRVERQASEQAQQTATAANATLAGALSALDLPEDALEIAAARGATEVKVAQLQDRLGEHDAVRAAYAEQRSQADAARAAFFPLVSQATYRAAELSVPVGAPPADADDLPMLLAQREAVRSAAGVELERLDEASARAELAGLRERHAAHVETGEALSAQHSGAQERIRGHLGDHGVAVGGHEPFEHLATAWPLLGEVDPAREPELAEIHADAQRETHFATRTATEVAAKHGLEGVDLDLSDVDARLIETEQSLRQRELAASLAREVCSRIVKRVLPETEAHMRALLPELTAGRYRDVTLLRPEDDPLSADLRIRVWDQAAGRYLAKELFSGGARDQFSLALRLAFALATLPKDQGAMPGFIFLDEPTSSFDVERSDALVQLLTGGEIGRHFAQVFLISHNTPFDPSGFHYLLRMGSGSVVESSLPSGKVAEHLWQTGG